MGNTFGRLFKVTTWGESHGLAMGVVVDGCPAGLPLTPRDIQLELNRRKPGSHPCVSEREEQDLVKILSGVDGGLTLGSPIALEVANEDARPKDYTFRDDALRPSHADFTYSQKYQVPLACGSGRASARETLARVAAGAIAKKCLALNEGIRLGAFVERVGSIRCKWSLEDALPSPSSLHEGFPCPDLQTAILMQEAILKAKQEGDSLGGAIVCRIQGVPVGLGVPVFDRLEADLAKAMLSIPAVKAFEVGSGFEGTYMTGSKHNDLFIQKGGRIGTQTNYSGGIQGGISNGEEIYFRVGFKPTSTIQKPQVTVNKEGSKVMLRVPGRHDPCVLPRAVPIVEAMAVLVIIDHYLLYKAQRPILKKEEGIYVS